MPCLNNPFGVLIAKQSMSISVAIIGYGIAGIVIRNEICGSCILENFGRECTFNFVPVLYPFIICNA